MKPRAGVRDYAALVCVMLIYATTFLVVKDSLSGIRPGMLIFGRSLLSLSVLVPFAVRHFRGQSPRFFVLAFACGGVVATGYLLQTVSAAAISPGKVAFLENAYCPVVPLLVWALTRRRPHPVRFVSMALALGGVVLISGGSWDGLFGGGEALATAAGVVYGVNIVLTGLYLRRGHPAVYTACQMTAVCLVSGLYTLFFEGAALPLTGGTALRLLYLGPVATGAAWLLRNRAQSRLSPMTVGVVLPFSAVVGTALSALFGWESLTPAFLAGAALMLAAILLPAFVRPEEDPPADAPADVSPDSAG